MAITEDRDHLYLKEDPLFVYRHILNSSYHILLLFLVLLQGCSLNETVKDTTIWYDLRGFIRPSKAKYKVNETIEVKYFIQNVTDLQLSEEVVDGSQDESKSFQEYRFNAVSQDGQNHLQLKKPGKPLTGQLVLQPQKEKLFVANKFTATKPGSYLLTFDLRWKKNKNVVFKPITIYVLQEQTKKKEIDPELEKALLQLTAEDPGIRARAKTKIRSYGEQVTPLLVKLMGHENTQLRSEAMYMLVSLESKAVPALLQGVRDKDREIRMRSIYALGQIGNEYTLPVLTQALEKDPDYEIRLTCLRMVSENFVDEIVIPLLIPRLNDKHTKVRTEAITILRRRTGKNFGYDPKESEKNRRDAIQRWKNWNK